MQADVQGLASIQQGDVQWLGGNHQAKADLVQLYTESLHGLHGLVVEGHLHIVPKGPGARDLQSLPLVSAVDG